MSPWLGVWWLAALTMTGLPPTKSAALWTRIPLVKMGLFRQTSESFGTPALNAAGNVVVAPSGDGWVAAFALPSGQPLWRFRHEVPFESAFTRLRLGEYDAVVGSDHVGELFAFELRTGRILWHTPIGSEARAEATLWGDNLYVVGHAGNLICLRGATGEIIWQNKKELQPKLSIEGHGRALVNHRQVFVGFADGSVRAVDAGHGQTLWEKSLLSQNHPFVDVDADPIASGDLVIFATYGEGVVALSQDNGQTKWQRPLRHVTSLTALGDQHVLVGTAEGQVKVLNSRDGVETMSQSLGYGPLSHGRRCGGLLAFAMADWGLLLLDGQTGRPVYQGAMGGRMYREVACSNQVVVAISSNGYLYVWHLS